MKMSFLFAVATLVLCASPLIARRDKKDPEPLKPVEGVSPDVDTRYLEAAVEKESPLRKANGVNFDIDAKVDRQLGGDSVILTWRLSYDGPRQPLTIVGPTVEGKTNGTTRLILYAVPEGSKGGWACEFVSPSQRAVRAVPLNPLNADDSTIAKELFLEVESGKQAKGEITIETATLRKLLAARKADVHFDRQKPPRLFVEMWHEPTDRGEKHSLDAWTGKLKSDVIEVPRLKNW